MPTANESKTRSFDELRDVIGYIENGGGSTIKIYQDDATKTWHIELLVPFQPVRRYWGDSLQEVITKAHNENHELVEPNGTQS